MPPVGSFTAAFKLKVPYYHKFKGKTLSHHRKGFRIIKPEIRVLGIDDGKFIPRTKGSVIVVGVVFRGGYSIDGVMHTTIAIDGLDATEKFASMINCFPSPWAAAFGDAEWDNVCWL